MSATVTSPTATATATPVTAAPVNENSNSAAVNSSKEGSTSTSPSTTQPDELNIDQLSSTNVFAFGLQSSYSGFGNEGENGPSGSAPAVVAGGAGSGAASDSWESTPATSDGANVSGTQADLPNSTQVVDGLTIQSTNALEQLVSGDGNTNGFNLPAGVNPGQMGNFQHPNGVDPYMYLNNLNMQGGMNGMVPPLSAHYMSLPNNIVPNVNFLGGSGGHQQNGPFGQQQQHGGMNGYGHHMQHHPHHHQPHHQGGHHHHHHMQQQNGRQNPSICKFYLQGTCARGEQCSYAHMAPQKGGPHMMMMMNGQQQPRRPRQPRQQQQQQPNGEFPPGGQQQPKNGQEPFQQQQGGQQQRPPRNQQQTNGRGIRGQPHNGPRMPGYGPRGMNHRAAMQQHQQHMNALQQGGYDPMMQMGGMAGGENMLPQTTDKVDPANPPTGSLLNPLVPTDPMNLGMQPMHTFPPMMHPGGMMHLDSNGMPHQGHHPHHQQHHHQHHHHQPHHNQHHHHHHRNQHDQEQYDIQTGLYAQSPMADFLSKFSTTSSPEELTGHIYMIAKDQYGCRLLQRMLDEQKSNICDLTFHEVFDHMNELMTDPFGNYLCQKLIEHCNENQRFNIISKVAPDLVAISLNMHGTRAVQKLVETVSTPKEVELVIGALRASVVTLIKDLNGNHVIQRCLHHLNSKDNQFIYDAVSRHCVSVATHKHGCCVLQRTIDYATITQKRQLVQEIVANALELVQDAFGNYVVQYVLDLGEAPIAHGIMQNLLGNISSLSVQKFSSNVVEKCLELANEKMRVKLIEELINPERLPRLLQDPYANYVIQKALGVSKKQQFERLVAVIKPHLIALRNTSFGKRIQNKILKKFPDLNITFDQVLNDPEMSPLVINAMVSGLSGLNASVTSTKRGGAPTSTAAATGADADDDDGLDGGAPGGMQLGGLNDPLAYLGINPQGEQEEPTEEVAADADETHQPDQTNEASTTETQ